MAIENWNKKVSSIEMAIEMTTVCSVVNSFDDCMHFLRSVVIWIDDSVQMEASIQLTTPLIKCMQSPIGLTTPRAVANSICNTYYFLNRDTNSSGNTSSF